MNETILFVDDDECILRAYQRKFRRYQGLQCAPGPHEALALLDRGETFAVVVCDLRMPGMDGIEFLELCRHRSPATVQILLTGNAPFEIRDDAVSDGRIFRVLTKPCAGEVLAKAVDDALTQHRLVTSERESCISSPLSDRQS